jgi:hypothetical protein
MTVALFKITTAAVMAIILQAQTKYEQKQLYKAQVQKQAP